VLPFCAVPIAAQTLSLNNTANAALDDPNTGADFVVLDTFSVQISGAATMSPVTVTEYKDGILVAQGYSNGWQTDINGDFTLPGTEYGSDIGEYTQMWYVNGIQVGNTLDFEVIPRPGSLSVSSATVASPNCSYPQNVGVLADVRYNILGIENGGVNIQTSVLMEPYEDGEAYGNNGVDIGSYSSDIGPKSGYSDSSQYAAVDGTFHDVPLGGCFGFPFGNGAGATQDISIYIGNNNYDVRPNQRWYFSGSSQGHGSVTNDNDVSVNQ
jgi:hypothetical protein